jgi:hypothetical protein
MKTDTDSIIYQQFVWLCGMLSHGNKSVNSKKRKKSPFGKFFQKKSKNVNRRLVRDRRDTRDMRDKRDVGDMIL